MATLDALDRIRNFKTQNAEIDDERIHLQNKNDWEIAIIFSSKIRRCLYLLRRHDEYRTEIEKTLLSLDRTLPSLVRLRNYEEHFDDYSHGDGRMSEYGWGELESYSYGDESFSNGVGKINAASIEKAAKEAWRAVQELEAKAITLGYLTWDMRHPKSRRQD